MATRTAVRSVTRDVNTVVYTWSGLLNGDVGNGAGTINAITLMGQLTSGTLGAAGTVVWQGSVDNVNWWPVNDTSNAAVSMTALMATKMFLERPVYVRPSVTGDGTTNLVANLVVALRSSP